jgi:hypothetical protein
VGLAHCKPITRVGTGCFSKILEICAHGTRWPRPPRDFRQAARSARLGFYDGKHGYGFRRKFNVKTGPVTLVSMTQTAEAEGESIPGPILRVGNTNSRLRFPLNEQVSAQFGNVRSVKEWPAWRTRSGSGGRSAKPTAAVGTCGLRIWTRSTPNSISVWRGGYRVRLGVDDIEKQIAALRVSDTNSISRADDRVWKTTCRSLPAHAALVTRQSNSTRLKIGRAVTGARFTSLLPPCSGRSFHGRWLSGGGWWNEYACDRGFSQQNGAHQSASPKPPQLRKL